MQDLKQQIESLNKEYQALVKVFNIGSKELELKDLEGKSTDPNLWDNPENAKKIMQKLGDLQKELNEITSLGKDITSLLVLADDELLKNELTKEYKTVKKRLDTLNTTSFLSGPYDSKNAIVSIHAGQGGTEAMDWSSMLYRMYLKYCENKKYHTETIDISSGEEAGLKSIVFKVNGNYAYGYLKGEAGTHRLVRQSPFNADKLRQTSFALVGVLPELSEVDLPDIKIKDEDCEWQFFRASTQGGQNVQKVSTAVRVKHIPTGIVVTSQTQRFQEQNRKIALDLLRAKLWVLEQERKEREVKNIQGEYKPASWGNQIRSYVLHPYKMVKDLRTGIETSDTEAVLNGSLNEFVEAEMKISK